MAKEKQEDLARSNSRPAIGSCSQAPARSRAPRRAKARRQFEGQVACREPKPTATGEVKAVLMRDRKSVPVSVILR